MASVVARNRNERAKTEKTYIAVVTLRKPEGTQ